MAIVRKKSVTRARKGQISSTAGNQQQNRASSSTTTTQPRTDTQTSQAAAELEIAFTFTFSGTKPVLPIGEVEPAGSGC